MSSILDIRKLTKNFGGLCAVRDVSFDIPEGQLRALIGPNGAGKTTIINMIAGALKPSEGEILFRQKPIGGLAPHRIAGLGIIRTFQNVNLFNQLTVAENVLIGQHMRCRTNTIGFVLGVPSAQKAERATRRDADDIMEWMDLGADANRRASELPFGKQRSVEIARALAAKPQLLLLDEPVAGLTAEESNKLGAFLKRVCREAGITVLLVEHNMQLVMDFADRIAVLDFGELIAEGTPEQVRKNPTVIKAYLGKERGGDVEG